jgi:hypothetical protein
MKQDRLHLILQWMAAVYCFQQPTAPAVANGIQAPAPLPSSERNLNTQLLAVFDSSPMQFRANQQT